MGGKVILPSVTAALILAAPMPGAAEVSGYAGVETRVFLDDPLYPGQDGGAAFSFIFEPEIYHSLGDSGMTLIVNPFFRFDESDPERTHFDLRELAVHKVAPDWELKAGLSKVFWGVTESRHLVDVINQTDGVEDIDGEDKLGQPMVQFSWIRPKGVLDLFLLPGFRERTFPGSSGRLRGALPVAVGSPVYLGDASEGHVDFAARWAQSVGPVDIGISCFYGVGRDPLFQPGELDGVPVLQPVYSLVHQGGLDIQYTGGNVLLKLEAIARSGPGQRIEAFVAGFEYTFYGLAGTNIDLGVLSEMHYDSRGVFSGHPLNDDIFSGFRAAFNDEKDTSVLAGMFYDLDNHSTSFRLEFERRIGSRMKLEIDFQKFGATDPMDPLRDLRNDSYLQIGLRRYF